MEHEQLGRREGTRECFPTTEDLGIDRRIQDNSEVQGEHRARGTPGFFMKFETEKRKTDKDIISEVSTCEICQIRIKLLENEPADNPSASTKGDRRVSPKDAAKGASHAYHGAYFGCVSTSTYRVRTWGVKSYQSCSVRTMLSKGAIRITRFFLLEWKRREPCCAVDTLFTRGPTADARSDSVDEPESSVPRGPEME
ncbi:hypothetical protein PG994_015157 [Apiospora phragmitis]|uniref:Uncharacterized protein n=1 Tax=Apiospora phragmitis TaxID=2905665 RepID=A0ABR1SXH5_9PEZI